MDQAYACKAIKLDSGSLATAAEQDLSAAVPSCPGWDVADLVWHVIEVHTFWRRIVAGRLQDPAAAGGNLDRPPLGALVSTFRHGAHELVDVLEAADLSTPVWTWSTQHDVAFVVRRMAQETAVHRWDAQAAQSVPLALEPELAADGLDEFATVMAPWSKGPQHAIELVSTDVAASTTLFPDAGDPIATLRGTASDLDLALWGRIAVAALDVEGDGAKAQEVVLAVGQVTG